MSLMFTLIDAITVFGVKADSNHKLSFTSLVSDIYDQNNCAKAIWLLTLSGILANLVSLRQQ